QKFDEEIAPNVRVISTNSWNKLFYVTDALIKIFQLRKEKFDVITSQDPTETGLVAYLASKIFKAALAIQDHGYHFHGNYYRKESWLNQFRYLFARFLIARADAIRVVSQRTEDALVALGIAKEKIVRFPLELTPLSLPLSGETSGTANSTSVDLQPSTFNVRRGYFLLVCRFVPIKRIDLAIHAFSIVAKQDLQVKLKIVGAGPLEDQVKQWIKDFDLQDRIEIIPWTDNLADLYRGAIATIITSDREGYGMTAVESLACGTPVIMTDVGCAGEVVKNNNNGIIVPVGDVMAIANAMEKYSTNYESARITNGFIGNALDKSMSDFLLSAINHKLSARKKEDENFWRFSEDNKDLNEKKGKRILVCVQAIDEDDALMGFFIEWLEEAVKHFSQITVLALRVGKYELPNNVKVIPLREKGSLSKFEVLRNVLASSWENRHTYDSVFVRGDCIYVLLAGWLWHIMGKKIIFWYAHYKTNRCVPWAAKIANTVVTSVPEACVHPKVQAIAIGQAINAEKFQNIENQHTFDKKRRFLVFGRVSEVKRVTEIIEAFKKTTATDANLTIIGKALTEEYASLVIGSIGDAINIKWQNEDVPYENVPTLYHEYDILINATSGSLDKTIVESMMNGMVVISVSAGASGLYNEEFQWLNLSDVCNLSDAIQRINKMTNLDLDRAGKISQELAYDQHSLKNHLKNLKKLI
ncbi:glycosyltransferase, partial [Candidatus Peregrinibacteria bacterium]|nr:glycosyltransferase [Candidatus Peregrinibacteria bacterium]